MAKSKPIAPTVHIGRVNLIRLASKVVDKVFEHVVHRGLDVKGKPFEKYSEGYKKETQGGKGRPDLHKTGRMMGSLQKKSTGLAGLNPDDSILVGWANPKSGQKLVWNESARGKKRTVTKETGTFPFNEKIGDWFFKEVDKILDRKVKKTSSKVVFKINM